MNLGTAFVADLDPVADKLMVAATLVLLCTRPPEDAICNILFRGQTYGCPANSGAAGTFYDTVPQKLIVNNHNMSTDTNTPFFAFLNQPHWTSVDIQEYALATVPLRWSRVQVVKMFT
ncbi:hypothetical protein Tco_1441589, partial [Tanacetum coccineum]